MTAEWPQIVIRQLSTWSKRENHSEIHEKMSGHVSRHGLAGCRSSFPMLDSAADSVLSQMNCGSAAEQGDTM